MAGGAFLSIEPVPVFQFPDLCRPPHRRIPARCRGLFAVLVTASGLQAACQEYGYKLQFHGFEVIFRTG